MPERKQNTAEQTNNYWILVQTIWISVKDSATCYCLCYAGLLDCTTESEESKKLRETEDNLVGHFGY